MYPYHWNKITSNSATSSVMYIETKIHSELKQVSRHYSLQRQTYCQNKYSWKKSIFNKIRHIQSIRGKLIILPTKPPTPDHIGYLVKSPLRGECYYSIFSNYEKMEESITFSAPFLRSSLPQDTKLLHPRIYFRVKKTDIDNQYDIYSRIFIYGSSMLEGVYFTV